ncbi:OpgC domain-containing protein [Paracidovorax sp. MALMAid1276]|uniref:OpgC domain-containing protein n=1 Tax=Paracidovorax sp. MALMAid1276 TaxID=3411631 RepID=UPI003B9AFEAB
MPASAPTRRWEIDALRGLMLVLMMVTHLPSRLSNPLGQPFGFVSAAEGFVLLSAYMAGMVYGRMAWRRGVAEMRRAFWRRALKVYACQAATLLFLFTVIAFIGLKFDQPAATNLMAYYLEHPRTALVWGLALVYSPPLLDILPLYILFMLASPWVMVLAWRHGWTKVMSVSVCLWLLAQFGLSEVVFHAIDAVVPIPVPYAETGSFDTWGWQLLWVLGLWLGATRNDPQAPAFVFPAWAVRVALVLALVALVWRHGLGQVPFGSNASWNLIFDKWSLGPMRLINLFALVVLTLHYGPRLAARTPRLRWLETLGAASLPVFCAHLVVVLLVLSLLGADQDRPWGLDVPLVLACFVVLHTVARISLWVDQPPDDRTGPDTQPGDAAIAGAASAAGALQPATVVRHSADFSARMNRQSALSP